MEEVASLHHLRSLGWLVQKIFITVMTREKMRLIPACSSPISQNRKIPKDGGTRCVAEVNRQALSIPCSHTDPP